MTQIDLGTNELAFEVEGGIAWLTFNRPQARNAMTWAMYEGLYQACERADTDDAIAVLVLRGAGELAFVSGTDISQFTAFTTPEHALNYETNQNRHIGRVEAVRKPTIAMLRGYCTGGGAAIAAVCDFRIAAPDVRYGIPIARTLGNTLSLRNIARLVALLGPARTKDLLMTGRFIEAEEGKAIGLFNEVVNAERLEARTHELAELLASNAPLTLRSVKEAVRRVLERVAPEEANDLVLMAYMSDDFREGVAAFLEKRPPRWKGR